MDSLSTTGDSKTALMQQVRQEAAIANARALVDKLNEHCFERCIPTPGSSMSSGEKQCFSACLEKYMNAWNVVSRQYVQRLQQRGAGGL
ncbi:Tim10/DDP family zinc finger-domain-containing protein [Phyllosticta capitalensis]|uniref:Mitochondrial import inner membrane translocase subunit n=1 Tax=Phyllosticta capitalensis TaxID=121624 RepID=A0ABR1YVF2_9PEZI